MAINRSQLAKELEPGLNALFGLEYARYENEAAEIFSQESSDRAFEEEVMLVGFGEAAVKTEGAAVQFDTAKESFTARYTHETIALAFALTEEAVEDNLYDTLSARYTKALARSMAYTKQVKGANVLNTAFTTTGGDGVSLVNTAHPTTLGGNFSNRILNSTLRVGTADNDINAMRNMGMLPEGYTVNHYLTDTDAWFLKTDCPNGFKHFTRAALATGMEGDFDTGNMRYKARERYSYGYSDPRCVYGSQGS